MKQLVGLITIGQSPRNDITPDLRKVWKNELDYIEKGVLDNFLASQIVALRPTKGEAFLVSRLQNGESVELGENSLTPLLKDTIKKMEAKVELVFLMCTGKFPEIDTKVPLIQPDDILRNTVKGLLKSKHTLGVLVPQKEQINEMKNIWKTYVGNEVLVEAGSPYSLNSLIEIEKGVSKLQNEGADLIVLDCMGYSTYMKKIVKNITGLPVVLPRTLIARIITELVS